jgi:hypothetical protein
VTGVLAALVAELVLITVRGNGADNQKFNPIPRIPVPAEYAGAFIVFGLLSLPTGRAQVPANVFAWGLVVATALNFFPETGPNVKLPGLTFISPSTPTASPTNIGASK